jgi:hypothetical protein
MAAFIVPDDGSGRVITFDVIQNELHETVVEVTDHPVEVGINVSDHIRPLPERLTLAAFTTNQPISRNPFTQRGTVTGQRLDIPQFTLPTSSAVLALQNAQNTPLEASVQTLTFAEDFDAIRETHEALLELQSNGVLLQIITSLRDYEDMVLERVAAPRSAGDSGVAFGLDVRKLRVVESGQVAAPPVPADSVPGGKPLQNKGAQGAKTPGEGEDESKPGSIAFQVLQSQGIL